jgi:hypothetical protein
VRAPWQGFGVNWQTTDYSSSTPSSTDWTNIYVPRLQFMKPGIVRLLMSVNYIGSPGTYNFNTADMTQLYRVLDYCQANNIPVLLTEWGNGWIQPSGWKLGDSNYINAIGAYMNYFINTKGYSCIKWFALGNEPNYDPTNYPNGISDWVSAVTALKNKFSSLGLSGFTIAGPDTSDTDNWVTSVASSHNTLVSAYDMHRYEASSYLQNSGFESNLTSTVWNSVVSSDTNQSGKPFIIGEAGIADGMSTNSNTNISTFNYGLWMADYGVQAARAKVGAIAAWSLDNNGVSGQDWGLWKSKASGYTLNPWWYTWSLLSHCVPAGSTIYAPTNPSSSVRVMGAQTRSGEWTFVAVNQGSSSVDLNFIASGNTQQTFSRYIYSSSSQPVDNSGIPVASSTFQSTPSAGVSCTVPATSVIVLTSVRTSAGSSSFSITAPATGTTVSGNISVTATATDNVGIAKVEFYVDSTSSIPVATDTASPYSFTWNSSTVSNGSHTLYAKASDAAGNSTVSTGVAITVSNSVADTTPPTVSITAPAGNATVSGNTTVTATASDNIGVTKVDFYVDNATTPAATATAAPYTFTWNTTTIANGSHTIYAKASDAAGNVGTSSVSVTVSNTITSGTYSVIFGNTSDSNYPNTVNDTFLDINTSVNATSTLLNAYTWPTNAPSNAILMQWNLSAMPANAQIQSATLQLYMNSGGGDYLYSIPASKVINKSPVISKCNGYYYDGTNPWDPSSIAYNSIPLAQADIAPAVDTQQINMTYGYKSWNVMSIVKDWVATPASNYGLLLNGSIANSADSYRSFASSRATDPAQRPKLVITYTTGLSPVQNVTATVISSN